MALKVLLVLHALVCLTLAMVPNPRGSSDLKGLTFIGQVPSSLTKGSFSKLYASEFYAAFLDAAQYCESNGVDGKLVSVLTHAQDQEIKTLLLKRDPSYFWTSGIFNPAGSVWVWYAENNSPLAYSNWAGGFPPAEPVANQCIYINSDLFNYNWNSLACSTPLFFICEVPV